MLDVVSKVPGRVDFFLVSQVLGNPVTVIYHFTLKTVEKAVNKLLVWWPYEEVFVT
jgi:hypothetical protein